MVYRWTSSKVIHAALHPRWTSCYTNEAAFYSWVLLSPTLNENSMQQTGKPGRPGSHSKESALSREPRLQDKYKDTSSKRRQTKGTFTLLSCDPNS